MTPAAEASLVTEWNRLRAIQTWDEAQVQEWSAVRRSLGKDELNHVGRIFEICVEQNAELAEGGARRKYKGRVVFQGNQAWDSNFDYAMLRSSPAARRPWKPPKRPI